MMQSLSCSIQGLSLKRLPGSKSAKRLSQLFEITLVLVRFDHVASSIVNANDGIGFGITTAESKAD